MTLDWLAQPWRAWRRAAILPPKAAQSPTRTVTRQMAAIAANKRLITGITS